tara:strand:+ start:42 stop:413 length:372 start_codon:yes stop_codon:yes gene_type:complete
MKKILLSLTLVLSYCTLSAQTVNGINLEDIPSKYVEVVSTSKLFKLFQVTVYLDYGQISKGKDISKGHIIGDDGKLMSFNGTMGVLNTLEKKGFKYLNQYLVTEGNSNVYRTLLENTNYKREE